MTLPRLIRGKQPYVNISQPPPERDGAPVTAHCLLVLAEQVVEFAQPEPAVASGRPVTSTLRSDRSIRPTSMPGSASAAMAPAPLRGRPAAADLAGRMVSPGDLQLRVEDHCGQRGLHQPLATGVSWVTDTASVAAAPSASASAPGQAGRVHAWRMSCSHPWTSAFITAIGADPQHGALDRSRSPSMLASANQRDVDIRLTNAAGMAW